MKIFQYVGLISLALLVTSCDHEPHASDDNDNHAEEKRASTEKSEQVKISNTTSEYGAWGVNLNVMKKSIAEGEDFFQHVNGGWLDSFEMPADKSRYGVFNKLGDNAEKQVKSIVENLSSSKQKPGTIEQKVGTLFNNYMDVETRNQLGIKPIQKGLDKIAQIKNMDDLIRAFGNADLNGTGAFAYASYSLDAKNPNQYIQVAGAGGFNLPDRDFYLIDQFKPQQDAYKAHIATMLGFIGYTEERAEKAAKAIYAIEKESAQNSQTRAEKRDAEKRYNIYQYDDFKSKYKGIDWDKLFLVSGFKDPVKKLNISSPTTLQANIDIINKNPISVWKDYLNFSLISSHAGYLSTEIGNASFDFWGRKMKGQQAQRDLWKRGIGYVSGVFGEAIGQVYVAKHFPESSKKQMLELVSNLRVSLKSRITQLPWMSDETKEKALNKLTKINSSKIGYPDKWEDYDGLEIVSGNLAQNLHDIRVYSRKEGLEEYSKPVDKTKWGMMPQTVNAYYHPLNNEVVFPAAILQPPFFNPSADPAVNYGAIGVVIGHELSHGFDDQGRKYNGDGILNDWWNKTDANEFTKRADILIKQFGGFQPIPGSFVDGAFTLGENIGDLGGVMIAYQAYKNFLNGKEAPIIDGYTGEQRFFLAYAQVWRGVSRMETLKQRLKSDPHSPAQYRVNGILPHVDAWYKAFNIKESDALYLAPEKRVRIW